MNTNIIRTIALATVGLVFAFAPRASAEDRAGAGIGGGSGGSISNVVVNGGSVTSRGGEVSEVSLQMVKDIAKSAAEEARAAVFDDIYPVGFVYVSLTKDLPAYFTQGGRKWERLATGRCLWNTSNGNGGLLAGSVPKIVASQSNNARGFVHQGPYSSDPGGFSGAMASSGSPSLGWGEVHGLYGFSWDSYPAGVNFNLDASRSSSVYRSDTDSATVRPTSVAVCMWRRTK